MEYIDTHFHTLHMRSKGLDVPQLYRQLQQEGFRGGIDAGTHPGDITERSRLLQDFDTIVLSGGAHPGALSRQSLDELLAELPKVRRAAEDGLIRFIGECGIDLYRSRDTLKDQQKLFAAQLETAETLKLPVIIHNRQADAQVLEMLKEYRPSCGGIMHCFSGDAGFAVEVQELGFHISFAGNITYTNSRKLAEALKVTDPRRLLLETDSPFLTPVPKRGRVNHPGMMGYTYACAAETLGLDITQLAQQTISSFDALVHPHT